MSKEAMKKQYDKSPERKNRFVVFFKMLRGLLSGSHTGVEYTHNNHEYVDLGLPSGLKWATMNVGANSASDYGQYFAWGEIEQKRDFCESNSETTGSNMVDIGGNPRYDVACASWGGNWRMPTKDDFEELLSNCTWDFEAKGDSNICIVTGPNGKQICLPATGSRYDSKPYYAGLYGYYWSSSSDNTTQHAFALYFGGRGVRGIDWYCRYGGRSVRPVIG